MKIQQLNPTERSARYERTYDNLFMECDQVLLSYVVLISDGFILFMELQRRVRFLDASVAKDEMATIINQDVR